MSESTEMSVETSSTPLCTVASVGGTTDVGGAPRSFASRWLPSGRGLPPAVWERRHRGILVLLYLQAAGLWVVGIVRGLGVFHSLLEAGIVAACAVLASVGVGSHRLRSAIATLGLITTSAVLVHMSGGTIEAHFHFFAMVGIITLYQDWVPFGLAIGYVALHHGVASTFDADSVYNHYAALNNPWKWAIIHGVFVLGASAANVFAWRLNEESASEAEAYRLHAEEIERRRLSALEINDNVVQGLAVVTSALALGETTVAREAAEKTIVAARTIISDLLGEGGEDIAPGSLRRDAAASSR